MSITANISTDFPLKSQLTFEFDEEVPTTPNWLFAYKYGTPLVVTLPLAPLLNMRDKIIRMNVKINQQN